MPLQSRRLGMSWSCAAMILLAGWTAGAMADTNAPTPGAADVKPHQAVSPGPPPLSPDEFDPDPNPLVLPETLPAGTNWSRRVSTAAEPPPDPGFNPDPGAGLKASETVGTPSWFTNTVTVPPRFIPPDVFPDLQLPRSGVRRSAIVPPTAVPGTFEREPLPGELQLPRENARRNLKIEQHFHAPAYSLWPEDYPDHTRPVPDRWKVGFTPWRRYTSGVVDQPGETTGPLLWHPYRQSLLKGDAPVIGQDIFLNLTATTLTEIELRRVPTPSGISAATPGSFEFYGRSEQIGIQNFAGFTIELFRGETAFKPVEWAIRFEPVFNVNYLNARETGVVSPDPRGQVGGNDNTPAPDNSGVQNPGDVDDLLDGLDPAGSFRGRRHTVRTRQYLALQQAFAEIHLRDLSDNYDFVAVRAGTQPFNSDFRGFLFNDINLGVRLLGNWGNNRYQYNAAIFPMLEKDTNSELNTFDRRDQEVFLMNFFWQDFLAPGYTAQWSFHANFDHGGTHYDRNGNIVRPAPIGTAREHDVKAFYFGWAGDGHIGRLNLSHAFYQVLGHDEFNGLAGRSVDINAQMAAVELSYDRDWARYKLSLFYASGDGDIGDGSGRGFDTILDNPNFTGGPFSYWTRQGFNLGGTLVNLKQRASLVPNLRTSKTQGQANFVNPGVFIAGIGSELELTPKLRAFVNLNYIRLMETEPIKSALLTAKADADIGWDLSLGAQYRPFLTDNVIVSAGFGALIPGRGFRDIYRTSTQPVPGFDPPNRRGRVDDFLYSALLAVTLVY